MLAALALPLPQARTAPPVAARISGKVFQTETNPTGVQSVSFRFRHDHCAFTLKDAKGEYPITCGLEKWAEGQTNMPGTPPKITVGDLRPCKVAACGAWQDENTFAMTWRFYETPHSDTVTCRFDGDKVSVEFTTSIAQKTSAHPAPYCVLQGRVQA